MAPSFVNSIFGSLLGSIFGITLLLAPNFSHAQFREEQGSLEAKYESRARAVLNTVLKPYEYSLVIAVDIDRDEGRLKDIETEYEKNSLPGMPGTAGFDSPSISNQLYELKTKVEVHLVVGELVSKERQETAGTLLRMKLRLEEKNGDTLTIVQSKLPNNVEPEPPAQILPELSWKMWLLVVIVGLLFLSALFLFWSRKSPKKKEDISPDKEQDDKLVNDPKPEAAKPADDVVAESKKVDIELDPNELLYEGKQQILSLATQYPQATIQALTEHFQKGEERDVLLMCESFGFEVAKKIFSDFSPRIWGKLGYLLVQRSSLPKTAEYSAAVSACGRVILKKFLEIGQEDTKNPFGFIWKLTLSDRTKLLQGESTSSLAMICLYSDKQQMAELFDFLSSDVQESITMHIVRLEKVSDQVLKSVVDSLSKKLKFIKENPEVLANGVAVAADLLKALPADKEILFFEKMKMDSPAQAEKIRRFTLMYCDLVHIPADVIADAAGLLDLNVLVTALRSGHEDVKMHILSSLPPKKALMIDKDLRFLDASPTPLQVANAKRVLVSNISDVIRSRGFDLQQFIPVEAVVRNVSQGAA